jgi:CheY-like chemotaxis protein
MLASPNILAQPIGKHVEKPSVALPPVVLIVEDEPILRMNAVDFIEEAGFQVVEAADADEAIQILERRPDIRIVLTDIQMPGSMDGLKLAAFVRNRWPPIELIITSARYVLDRDLPERGVFLPKPYSPRTVVEILQRLAA